MLLAIVKVGGRTQSLPTIRFSEFSLVNSSGYQNSILSQQEPQRRMCFVDNRDDHLSGFRRITWFIPGLTMVIIEAAPSTTLIRVYNRSASASSVVTGA